MNNVNLDVKTETSISHEKKSQGGKNALLFAGSFLVTGLTIFAVANHIKLNKVQKYADMLKAENNKYKSILESDIKTEASQLLGINSKVKVKSLEVHPFSQPADFANGIENGTRGYYGSMHLADGQIVEFRNNSLFNLKKQPTKV